MASVLLQFEVDDYDRWKQRFDSDPAGRKQSASGHTISRGTDNPNAVFVRLDFPSVEEARSFRERLLDSGALNDFNVKLPPTVAETAEEVSY
jgi:hypothetical protein